MIDAERVRQRVGTLPSMPTTVLELGRTVRDERCTVDRVLAILTKDPGLTATLLRLANSVMHARDGRVMDLRSAVMRLGFDAIFKLGQSAAIIKSIRGGSHLDRLRLWQHSVAVGEVAKGVCRLIGQDDLLDQAYLAGLLHDIGKIALDQCFSDDYGPVVEAMAAGEFCLDAERRILGLDHAQVGAMVAVQWNFPEPLVRAIREHHDGDCQDFLAYLIQLSDLLVRTRIPNSPADEGLAFVLAEQPAFSRVFQGAAAGIDEERLTFGIDDELDHAVTFVKLVFQD